MGDKSIRNDKVKKKKKAAATSVMPSVGMAPSYQGQPELIKKKKKER